MSSKKNSLEKRRKFIAIATIAILIVIMLLIEAAIIIHSNLENVRQTSVMLMDQIDRVIEQNEIDEAELIASLKEEYVIRAKAVSYILTKNPRAKTDLDELKKIASLVYVDEIHLFSTKGEIFSGTMPQYYGLNFDSGTQISFFRPILSDRNLSLCQDMVPNTAENRKMMYAMVWADDFSCLVQVGIEPMRLLHELNANEISKVVGDMPMYKGFEVIVADKKSEKILGATDPRKIGKTLDEIKIQKKGLEFDGVLQTPTKINGKKNYCTVEYCGNFILCVTKSFSFLGRTLYTNCFIMLVYLFLAALISMTVLEHLQAALQKEKDERSAEQMRSVKNLRRQLSIIEAVSDDCTEIILIDPETGLSTMLKQFGKMKSWDEVQKENGLPYNQVWKNFILSFIEPEDQENLYNKIELENVKKNLAEEKEYSCNCKIKFRRKIFNYQVRFILAPEEDGKKIIIATLSNIDKVLREEEKRQQLIHDVNTDKLTGLFNRRAYETEMAKYGDTSMPDDFVFVAMDLNGLKDTNDILGHEAGDELLQGAAECMKKIFCPCGKVFRMGGDEFVATIFASERDLEELKTEFETATFSWQGEHVKELSISAGYVMLKEFPNKTVRELATVADERMYREKEEHYSKIGVDRRNQQIALKTLCGTYIKILKVNLTEDRYERIKANPSEKKFEDVFSKAIYDFAELNLIHRDDLEHYFAYTNIDTLRSSFKSGNRISCVNYRRMIDKEFRRVMMEIIPAPEYTNENQIVFLFVKNLEPK
jgi:diguanylate cyclase (GGDEF)-like protein